MLTHSDIWRAIDRLAETNGFSPSGLAIRAGLNSTSFNVSKRINRGRKRWPSTESIAAILRATNTPLDVFVSLAQSAKPVRRSLPLLTWADAGRADFFDDKGHPVDAKWDEAAFAGTDDAHAFILEVSGKSMEPVYREGDRLVVSPAAPVRRGDRVVVKTGAGEILVRQMLRDPAGKIELATLNAEEPALILSRRDVAWCYRIIWASQ